MTNYSLLTLPGCIEESGEGNLSEKPLRWGREEHRAVQFTMLISAGTARGPEHRGGSF